MLYPEIAKTKVRRITAQTSTPPKPRRETGPCKNSGSESRAAPSDPRASRARRRAYRGRVAAPYAFMNTSTPASTEASISSRLIESTTPNISRL